MYTVMMLTLGASVGVLAVHTVHWIQRAVRALTYLEPGSDAQDLSPVSVASHAGDFEPPMDLFEQIRRGSSALD